MKPSSLGMTHIGHATTGLPLHVPTATAQSSFWFVWHTVLMFLVVFGPRLFGSFILDTLSAACAGSALYYFASRSKIDRSIINVNLPVIAFLTIISVYAVVISLSNVSYDMEVSLKFIRAILNWIGVCALCAIISEITDDPVRYISRLFILSVAIHCIIVVAQLNSPYVADLIVGISGYDGTSNTRYTGLTWSFNATNIVNSVAISMLIFSRFEILNRIPSIILATFILFTMANLGRTTFFIYLLLTLVQMMTLGRGWLIASLAVLASTYLSLEFLATLQTDDVRLYHLLDPVRTFMGYENSLTVGLQETWMGFFVLPNDYLGLMFGEGVGGRGEVYVASDIGYILMIWSIGIVGTLAVVLIHLYILAKGLRYEGAWSTMVRHCVASAIIMILVVSWKEQEFFVRHIISSLAVLSWFMGYDIAQRTRLLPSQKGISGTLRRSGGYGAVA